MKSLALIILFFSLVLLTGCRSEVTLDGTSDEALTNSINKIKRSLSPAEWEEFSKAMCIFEFEMKYTGPGFEIELELEPLSDRWTDSKIAELHKRLHGKPAKQIIEEGRSIAENWNVEFDCDAVEEVMANYASAVRTVRRTEASIRHLEDGLEKALRAQNQLREVVIEFQRLYSESELGLPIFEVKATNKTNLTVEEVVFTVNVRSAGRKVPWAEGEITHEIVGGIEPNETSIWKIQPSAFDRRWDEIPFDRNDIEVEMELVKATVRTETESYDIDASSLPVYERHLKDQKQELAEWEAVQAANAPKK